MNWLKKLAFVLALMAASPSALAEFRSGMTLGEMEDEVVTQVSAGRTVNDIANAAFGVGLEPGLVTVAMINAGVAPLVAIGATINAGAPREAVRAGALAGGVPNHEAVAMILVWLPEAAGNYYGASLISASEPTPDLGSSGGSGGGPIASPN
jgi:hypothetical protein